MNSKKIILFVFVLFFETVWGQELNQITLEMYGLIPVSENDVHWNIVQSEIERITKLDPNSLTGNRIDYYGLLKTKDANSLFPNWKFYLFTFSMYAINPADKNRVSMALGLKSTLAVSDSNTVKTFVIYNSNDYEKFLKLNKISIRDANDAKLVWKSLCEIHKGGTKDLEVEKVSDNEWKLDVYSYKQTVSSDNEFRTVINVKRFYKITTDPDTYLITKSKYESKTSDRYQEKIE